jgi:3-deoxy-manno-octulosonate cytidylyltransferase (CMP-KDO synthetase)
MNIYAIIPARYGSSRFPGKPLTPIAGKPMVQHVFQCAASCPEISHVVVATDDERIFKCVHDFNGKAIMTRPDHRSGTDRIAEAALQLGIRDDDLIVNIQGDQPLFHTSVISDLVAPMRQHPDIPMGTLKYRIRVSTDIENPNIVKVVTDHHDFAMYFSRFPIPFHRDPQSQHIHYKHIGMYVFRKDFLITFSRLPEGHLEASEKLEQLRVLENGFQIKVTETASNSLEVDRPEDIKKVEEEMERICR